MLKLQNTLSGKKDIFKPRKGKSVRMFVCGPTVYDLAHIGHARTYIAFDMISKYLKEKGYSVYYLQNITDIDDKILIRAKERNIPWKDLSLDFEKKYLDDMKSLKVNGVKKYARATAHIKEIISQVQRLMKKGFAYQIEDGIYYDVSKFKEYGKLSKRTVSQAEDGVSRIDESLGKKNKGDFCLWKFSKPEEPKWKSPFGYGRPGWHIEDTAITEKFFGPQYDIHGGARDLIFPHHEAEIAQIEAVSGKSPLVKYWLHTGFLTVNGVKMSKSLKNFITIRDFLEKYEASPVEEFRKDFSEKKSNLESNSKFLYGARILRLFVLKSHYRSPIDYTEKAVVENQKLLERIDEFLNKLSSVKRKKGEKKAAKNLILEAQKNFNEGMEDDLNTPVALAAIFNLISSGNALYDKGELSSTDAKEILKFFKKIDKFLSFIFWQKKAVEIPASIKTMAADRENARKEGNWKLADEMRQKIKDLGYQVEDTAEGSKIKKLF